MDVTPYFASEDHLNISQNHVNVIFLGCSFTWFELLYVDHIWAKFWKFIKTEAVQALHYNGPLRKESRKFLPSSGK